MQERHFSFHLAQTVCSDHHKVRFRFTKNNGLLNWQEGKENSSNTFPAKIAHLRHWRENMLELFFPLRPRTSTMFNRGSYLVLAQIFLALARMGLALARMGVGERGGVACVPKGVVFNHVLEIRCLNFYNIPAVLFRAEKKSV